MTVEKAVMLLMSGNAPYEFKGRDLYVDNVVAVDYKPCVLLRMQCWKPTVPSMFQSIIHSQKLFIMFDVSMHYSKYD